MESCLQRSKGKEILNLQPNYQSSMQEKEGRRRKKDNLRKLKNDIWGTQASQGVTTYSTWKNPQRGNSAKPERIQNKGMMWGTVMFECDSEEVIEAREGSLSLGPWKGVLRCGPFTLWLYRKFHLNHFSFIHAVYLFAVFEMYSYRKHQ